MWEPGLSRGATKGLKKCNYLKIKYYFRTFLSKLLGKAQSLLNFLRKRVRKSLRYWGLNLQKKSGLVGGFIFLTEVS